MGLSAGIGAITLPKPMGLDPEPVAKNDQVKILTVGYYLAGAVVTGLVSNLLKKEIRKKGSFRSVWPLPLSC
jgi:hypothetical protein